MIKKAGPDGTVLLAADKGTYNVNSPIAITGAGTDGHSITIKGVNSDGSAAEAHFAGSRPANWVAGDGTGNELFRIMKGADNLNFTNLSISNTGLAFHVVGDVKNLSVTHVDAQNVQRFFDDLHSSGNTTATISGLTLKDINVEGYSKGAIRLQDDTHDVIIDGVIGNSGRQDGDHFAVGVDLRGTVHAVAITNSTMENSTDNEGTGHYWNGDGFLAEEGVHNLSFTNTVARGNTDGGYDIKASSVTMNHVVSEDNGRNFRFWGHDVTVTDAVGLNPDLRGGSSGQAQVWLGERSQVTIIDSTFSDSGSKTSVIDNHGTAQSLQLINTTITHADSGTLVSGVNPIGLSSTVVHSVAATGGESQGAHYSDGSPVMPLASSVDPGSVVVTVPTSGGGSDWVKVAAAVRGDTYVAMPAAEKFVFDQSHDVGKYEIKGFGSNDLVAFANKLADPDNDGLVTFAKDGSLQLNSNATLAVDGLTTGLRLLGQGADGYIYGDAAVWAAGSTLPAAPLHDVKVVVNGANQTMTGTGASETFIVDQAGKGKDVIKGFGSNDLVAFANKLADSNNDGVVTFGKSGALQLNSGATLAIEGVKGLRLLGHTADGYVYGDAARWVAGSTLPAAAPNTSADWLKFVATSGSETFVASSRAEMFAFDQATATGKDVIQGFGPNDLVASTSKLPDGNNDGVITSGKEGTLELNSNASLAIDGLTKGLRLLGHTADGYIYGDASVWAAGSAPPTATQDATFTSTAANETYIATNARETFDINTHAGAQGADVIRGFGASDVLVTGTAIADGNGDGIVNAGQGGFSLGDGASSVKLPEINNLRLLGSTAEGYLYGDAAVRPTGAIEGKLGAADVLTGDKVDTATDKFFFDNALNRSMGADKLINFGAKDVIITTSAISTGAAGSHVDAVNGQFALGHFGLSQDSVAISDTQGHAVTSLEFDGDQTIDGVHYYVYSAVGSSAGLPDLAA